MLALNKDMDFSPNFPLIRRKYFMDALGAKPWEIFAYATTLYTAYTDDPSIPCPYLLDGLIFQPLEQSYTSKSKESQKEDYKWKPPNKNSIDFYIEFEKDKETHKILKVYDNSYSSQTAVDENTLDIQPIRNKTYKICNLYAGNKLKDKDVPELFKEDQELHLAYLFLTRSNQEVDEDIEHTFESKKSNNEKSNNEKSTKDIEENENKEIPEVRDQDGDIISDKTVVEFYYNNDPTVLEKFRWVPIKTRYDKTESVLRYGKGYGNYHTIAHKVWQSIINPTLMSDFEDLAKGNIPEKNVYTYDKKLEALRKKIGYDIIASTAIENAYYQERSNLAKPMRNYHNWIKSNIIFTFCHQMYQDNRQLSVYDLGVGRGGDIMKYYHAKVAFLVGTDVDKEGIHSKLDGCYSRYNKFRKGKPNFPRMFFFQADATAELDYDNQVKALKGMDEQNKYFMEKFFPKDKEKKTLFDCISCQFAIHYMFRDDGAWSNFKVNLNNHLRNGGYLMVTTFDADKIMRLLENRDSYKYEYTDAEGDIKTLFEIVKKYPTPANKNVVMGPGNAIDVKITWIALDRYTTEYLVDSRFISADLLKDCGLEMVDTDSFDNQLKIHREFLTNYSRYESNPKTNKYLHDVKEFYGDSAINVGCQVWNTLMRYYVFRKKDGVLSKQKGGKGGMFNFSDTRMYTVPPMDGYDPEYSFQNSIHNILRNGGVIPKPVKVEELFRDLGLKLVKDEDLSENLMEKIAGNVIINHEVPTGGGKIKNQLVVNGLNVFVVERDCNNQYDIELVEGKAGVKSSVILMREGLVYNPVYYVNPQTGGRQGILDDDEELVREMLKRVDE